MPVALVTGSAKGLGRAMLYALAQDGYDVIIHYQHSYREAQSLLNEVRTLGVKADMLAADVTDPEQAQGLIEQSYGCFGRLDVLINNVGNYFRGGLEHLSINTWHEMMDSNLHSCFYTCQRAIPLMKAQGSGRIINIGYAGAEHMIARPSIAAYSIAKTGVILYSKALAKSYASQGITVNVISPGVIENSISQPSSEIPMRRLGYFSEIVAAMRYLLSDQAAYITGITLEVAGGWNV